MTPRPQFSLLCLLLVASFALPFSLQAYGVKKTRPKFRDFGTVVIDNYSTTKNEAAVAFPHWLHRAKYTCRVCHVDVGFAMKTGRTDILEADNLDGMFCGACHNGKIAFAAVMNPGTPEEKKMCDHCHSVGREVVFKNNFREFRRGLPRDRFGNGINWMAAEKVGKIKLIDHVEGISVPQRQFKQPVDLTLSAKEKGMPNILFSHEKHAVWNGCETCHPEIFPVRKSAQTYSMQALFEGKYCGVCHDTVAFPNIDCQGCHTDEVY